jgi:sugar phosphate isomerase/epimerase
VSQAKLSFDRDGFPFRLGCTSYVIPDDIVPNVAFVAGAVDDIELVLFESDDVSNLPDRRTVEYLARMGERHDLSYTVHFPIDRKAGSADPAERDAFARQACRIVNLMNDLAPFAYVLHLDGLEHREDSNELTRWRRGVKEVCEVVANIEGLDPTRVAVENLAYPVAEAALVAKEFGFSLCLDTGHLWRYESEWQRAVEDHLRHTRVVHFHGCQDTVDHLPLSRGPHADIRWVADRLRDYRGVITVEVFDRDSLQQSVALLEELWRN